MHAGSRGTHHFFRDSGIVNRAIVSKHSLAVDVDFAWAGDTVARIGPPELPVGLPQTTDK